MPRTDTPSFQGFSRPTYTTVPDELFDILLPTLSDAELRVLLYIVRRTFGFKRDSDSISLSQMVSGIITRDGERLDAGVGLSKSSVARGLKSLREKGIILATRNSSAEKGDQPTTYRLRFTSDTSAHQPPATSPVSHQQDTPPVAPTRQGLLQDWDTQQTARQETDFEYSKGKTLGSEMEQPDLIKLDQSASPQPQTSQSLADSSLAEILRYRIRRDVGRDARGAITVAMEQFADELGDQAALKVSVSRALNLYQASDLAVGSFVDLLYQARGEVIDRKRYPGKAPVPRNQMAYFFALVEDRLGLRQAVE